MLKELGPVADAARHETGKDKVEWVMERPCILDILDEEGDVWGYAMGAWFQLLFFGGQQAAAGLTTQAGSGSSRRRLYELRGGRRLHVHMSFRDTQQRVTGPDSLSGLPKSMAQSPVPHPASRT